MRLRTKIALPIAAALTTLGLATPAIAWPTTVHVSHQSLTTGAMYSAGTGSVRAWQYCESSSGQTNWYNYGPWRGIYVWSWTGTCYNIRSRGFDARNY